ncbi:nicastrin [Diabrotica undecimpunctata]|uniref:nicastrin n=1 Tax=Diabrotica undecimpunctata TaxID=50387 RepID=UPI003B64149B
MNNTKSFVLFLKLLILVQFITKGYGIRTKDKMYETVGGTSACYRRLNATHQTGCTSKWGGSNGVIHFCETHKDLEDIIANGTSPPYIPIVPPQLFNTESLQFMISSKKIDGLIIQRNNDTLEYFTHEYQCPNPSSSLDGTCNKESVWNPLGTGLMYADIPFPIFYIENQSDINTIRSCFKKFNNYSFNEHIDRSLCALELKAFMYAATNTPTCRRRSDLITTLNPVKFCDPLGDSNIWASLYPLAEGPKRNETKAIKDYSFIVVAARFDTTSLFEDTSGANNPVTSIVTLLSLAKFLNDSLTLDHVEAARKNVLFFLFNGETYDYIGSQRMLYDMVYGNFPIDNVEGSDILPPIIPKNIELFIEISQLGNANKTLYVHSKGEDQSVSNFTKILQQQSTVDISFEDVPDSLPPASLHTFKKAIPNFPGLIISDHKTSYANRFYNSIFDDADNIGFKYYNVSKDEEDQIPKSSIQHYLANVTEVIGKSIYKEITGSDYNGNNIVDVVLVNELLHCYLEDQNCKVHQAVHKNLNLPKTPMNLYVGVERVENFATNLAALTLGWFTGQYAGPGNINCTNKPRNYAFKYYNMSTSIYDLNVVNCYKVTMNTTKAVSPAFNISDYNWSSGQYSSWTESTWADIKVRVFLKPAPSQERTTLAVGCVTIIFSFILVYFIKSRSHIFFTPPVAPEAPTSC